MYERVNLDSQLQTLMRINTQDMLEATGLDRLPWGRALLERLCRPLALRFARQLVDYDLMVGGRGLREGGSWLLRACGFRLEVSGQENVPAQGPLLIVSNHPGLADTIALFSSLPRQDLKVVAADRPFLRALHNTSRQLIYLRPSEREQIVSLRTIANHLRRGGAVLLFPGGKIEPDPALAPDAARSLEGWSKSIGLIVRLAKHTQVVPAVVSGVLSASAQRHPVTRLRRAKEDRERLGAMLQIAVPAYRSPIVRISFGQPLTPDFMLAAGNDAVAITEIVIKRVQSLFDQATEPAGLRVEI
jgi:1-acyl-sn-glycerol-3-phosphate acyltransferase